MPVSVKEIVEMRKVNPCATLKQIGDSLGVTRERIRQILKRVNIETRNYKWWRTYQCPKCGRNFHAAESKRQIFCSQQCWNEYRPSYTHIKAECSQCHKLFEIRKIDLNARTKNHKLEEIFCSRRCYGKWFGYHYGAKRKYDYDLIWQKHLETGYGSWRLAKLLGIPSPTVESILHKMRLRDASSD